ncbi:MAG: dihydroorotate dehydrogenase-like protein [Anaerolineae bacterium]|nr:MAG: dihydroorotate dehydrogenase-like protein [Anaerolineae bacterium]
MVDLKTTYLGLNLKNPLVASASPLSERVESARQLEQAGASAIVMYSLFEEQIVRESLAMNQFLEQGTESYAEALSYFSQVGRYSIGPERYLEQVKQLKDAVAIPIIASLNGISRGRWIEYAQRIENSGADALELNLYFVPTDPNEPAGEIEDGLIDLVGSVRKAIAIPLAVKISPYFTSLPQFAQRLADAGANGLVLFNRFYQPDIDLNELEVTPSLSLSEQNEIRLPLRWIAILSDQVSADFALTSGVRTGEDIIKAMMVGAKVAMTASELLRHGPLRVSEILAEVAAWMEEHDYDSIVQMQGSMSQNSVMNPGEFERANYMKVLSSYSYLP